MEFEDYKLRQKELEKEFENKKIELMKEFVRANNPYKAGDLISDSNKTISIEKMGFDWGYYGSAPCATYTGTEINKDGKPNKKGKVATIWQRSIVV